MWPRPQSRHEQDTLMFLEAGKPVLCEKPFALNQAQSQRMIDAARQRGLLLMEAMWSRFLPAYRVLADLLGRPGHRPAPAGGGRLRVPPAI